MTDKEKILAEIESELSLCAKDNPFDKGRWTELNHLKLFINSLPEEPVSEDLEAAAITAADEDMQGRQIMEESNENRQLYSRIFRRGFKAGAQWQKE